MYFPSLIHTIHIETCVFGGLLIIKKERVFCEEMMKNEFCRKIMQNMLTNE